MDELWSRPDFVRLNERFEIVWGRDEPIPPALLASELTRASFLIAARPAVDAVVLSRAPNLSEVIEVSGAGHDRLHRLPDARRRGSELRPRLPARRRRKARSEGQGL